MPILHYAPPPDHNRFILTALLMFIWAALQIATALSCMLCGIIGGLITVASAASLTSFALVALPFVGLLLVFWGFHSVECGVCLFKGQRVSLRGQRIAMRILESLAYVALLLPIVSVLRHNSWHSLSSLAHAFARFLAFAAFAAYVTITRIALRRASPAGPRAD